MRFSIGDKCLAYAPGLGVNPCYRVISASRKLDDLAKISPTAWTRDIRWARWWRGVDHNRELKSLKGRPRRKLNAARLCRVFVRFNRNEPKRASFLTVPHTTSAGLGILDRFRSDQKSDGPGHQQTITASLRCLNDHRFVGLASGCMRLLSCPA